MRTLKGAVRKAITLIPRSRALSACCRLYCEHCGEAGLGILSDPTGGGEYRFLREVAPALEVVLDVGANVGDWTAALLAVKPTTTIHAFEPAAGAFQALERRGFPSNVSVHQTALSSSRGCAALHLFGEASQLNSLHNRHGIEDCAGVAPATQSEQVELLTVDEFCLNHGLRGVDLMKVDTEGHEVDVLKGSLRSLASGNIRRVQFEYGGTYIDSRRLLKDAFEIFLGLNYQLYRIVSEGLVACPRYDQRLENFQYANYVALRRDTIDNTPSAKKAWTYAQRSRLA
jgi:FkbM family methyltransferase